MSLNSQREKVSELDKIRDDLAYSMGEHDITLAEIMSDEFVRANTEFASWEAMVRASNVKTERDLETREFNEFVKLHTRFEDWQMMLIHCSNQYYLRREVRQ